MSDLNLRSCPNPSRKVNLLRSYLVYLPALKKNYLNSLSKLSSLSHCLLDSNFESVRYLRPFGTLNCTVFSITPLPDTRVDPGL